MANFSAPNQKPIKLGSVKYVKPKREISALAILCNFYTFRCTPVFSLSKKPFRLIWSDHLPSSGDGDQIISRSI